MTTNLPGETWKKINFKKDVKVDGVIEISNLGRVRSFLSDPEGKILGCSMINGYRILKLRLYQPRDEKIQKQLDTMLKQVSKLEHKIKEQRASGEKKSVIKETEKQLAELKSAYYSKSRMDVKARTVYSHSLVHRLVVDHFLPAPKKNQTVVAHLDFDKLNNSAKNLKWMTQEENIIHQQKSPFVIKEMKIRLARKKAKLKEAKLAGK